MKRNSFLILTICFVFIGQPVFAQAEKSEKKEKQDTYVYYAFAGLGSNLGSFEPTLRITGTKFNYTYEQNSYWGKKSKRIDKISSGEFRQSSVDSILSLVKDLRDTLIFKSNPGVMSGGIYFLTISNGTDTTEFELMNTFDYTALKVINIINQYLPTDKKILVTEELIKWEEEYFESLRKKIKKRKSNW